MPFAIKNAQGLFFTEVKVVETKEFRNGSGQLLGTEDIYRPVFEGANEKQASKYGTEDDCNFMMGNPAFGGPDSFAGCQIVPAT